jgi:hypothetical protein
MVLTTTRLQGKSKGACIRERYGSRSSRAAKPVESSKLELACLHLGLLTHLQRNMFIHGRLFLLLAAEPSARLRRGYISSLSASAHPFASRGQLIQ